MATKKSTPPVKPSKPTVLWCSTSDANAQTLHAMGKNGYRLSAVDSSSGIVYFRLESGFADPDPSPDQLLAQMMANQPH